MSGTVGYRTLPYKHSGKKIYAKSPSLKNVLLGGFTGLFTILPSRKLTYPTWEKGKSSSKVTTFRGIC